MPLQDSRHRGLDFSFITDIADGCADIAGALRVDAGDLCGYCIKFGGLPAHQRDMRAEAGKLVRRAPAQPATPPVTMMVCPSDSPGLNAER